MTIHTFQNEKDKDPHVVEIEKATGKVLYASKVEKYSLTKLKNESYYGIYETFLPAGYPYSVSKNYLRFTVLTNIAAMCITTMSFLST